jgi:putative ABC transport system permease protein
MRRWLSRLAELFFRRSREERLSSEIQHHLDLLAQELQQAGMPEAEARLAARKQFGGVDRIRISHREQRGVAILETLLQDVRFAWRVLMRDRGFALTAIIVLGVGLGVNNMFFTLAYAHLFRGVPVEGVERVLFVSTFDDRVNDRAVSLPEYDDLRAAQSSFSSLGAFVNGTVAISDEGHAPDRFNAAYVSADAFAVVGVSPSMGRLPSPDDDRPGGAPVALLGTDAWRLRYANDPHILGRTIRVNGSPATVIGIIRERSGFPSTASVWLPLGQWPEWKPDRSVRSLRLVGRLKNGVSEESARHEVETIFGRFETAHPETNRNLRARVVPLNQQLLGTLGGWMQFIFAGIIVILVACANVANLMIARALHRAPEMAIRTSLGASRARLIVQLLTEAAVIAGGGAIVGAFVSIGGVRAVQSGIPEGILPYWFDYSMDRTIFLALAGLSLATIVVFGLLPAMHASRTDVNRTLKDGGRSATTAPAMRAWTGAFLTVQLALAMILVAQVAVATYVANRDIPTDAKVNTTDVLTATITLPAEVYPTADRRMEFFARLGDQLRARPEIVADSRATVLPGDGGFLRRVQVRGQESPAGTTAPTALTIDVAPRYFESLALGLVRGRDFTTIDGTPGREVAIVNERFTQVFFGGVDPVGTEIAVIVPNAPVSAPPQWLRVVGIAPTIRQQGNGGADQQAAVVYRPLAASAPATSTLMVRHRVDPETAAAVLRAATLAVDANVPLSRVRTLERAVRDAQWNRHISAVLAETVSFFSVLLTIVGLYAVTAQRVTLKTREIGLRMALGARPLQVAKVVIAGLRVPLVLGLLLGTAGAMAWDGVYASGIAGVYTSAPPTLLKIAALITVCVMVSCFIPVRRATATNPMSALRHD